MLTVNNLTKRYGDVLANSKVTFTAEDGQITLMVGPTARESPRRSNASRGCSGSRVRS